MRQNRLLHPPPSRRVTIPERSSLRAAIFADFGSPAARRRLSEWVRSKEIRLRPAIRIKSNRSSLQARGAPSRIPVLRGKRLGRQGSGAWTQRAGVRPNITQSGGMLPVIPMLDRGKGGPRCSIGAKEGTDKAALPSCRFVQRCRHHPLAAQP
jgi:hypothetical protein